MNNNWWDGRDADSFFLKVYRLGDNSFEGHLEDRHLDIQSRTIRECDMVESILNLPKGSKILDCPCGYGRHSLELARRGYHMTGVDLCTEFLEEARANAQKLTDDQVCTLVHGDMRSLPGELQNFDACINMFLSFGFFDDKTNTDVLEGYYNALRPGGILLIHSDVNPDRLESGKYVDRATRQLKSGDTLFISEAIDPATNTLNGSWTIQTTPDKKISGSYSVRIYTHKEMNAMVKAAGFMELETIYPSDLPHSTDNPCQEIIYVARRQA